MADQYNYDSTQPVRSQVSANYTPTGLYNQENLNNYNANREAQIKNVYDTALTNTKQELKTAYDQNLSDLQAARDKISPQYQSSINQLTAEYERQRRNNNMQAAANGLNTGAGSQMQLGQMNIYASQNAGLRRSENEALNEANRGIADLGVKYQNDIAQAVANNDYKLAAAMLDEYENQYNRQMNLENTNYQRERELENQAYERAYNEENRDYSRNWNLEDRDYTRAYNEENRDYTRAYNEENRDYTRQWETENRDYERAYNEENRDYTRAWNEDERDYERAYNEENRDYSRAQAEAEQRAQFGDFSGYAAMYGQGIADAMKDVWVAQNPMVAWKTGAITDDQYMMLTGKYPYNYGSSSGSSSYSGYSGGGGYGTVASYLGDSDANSIVAAYIAQANQGHAVEYNGSNVGTGYTLAQADQNAQLALNAPNTATAAAVPTTRGGRVRAAQEAYINGQITEEQYLDVKHANS